MTRRARPGTDPGLLPAGPAPALALLALVVLGAFACEGERSHGGSAAAGGGAGDSLGVLAQALYDRQEYDSARDVWLVSLESARRLGDRRREGVLLTSLAQAAWRMGDTREGRILADSALRLKQRFGPGSEIWRSYNILGLIALAEDRNADAATLFERALRSAVEEDQPEGIRKAPANAGLAYTYLGQRERARGVFREARAAAHRDGDARLEASSLANEAMVDVWEGAAQAAIARLDTVRALYPRGDRTGEQNALGQKATALELLGDYDGALAALDSALDLAREVGAKGAEAEALRLIAELQDALGDHRRAVRGFAQAAALGEADGYAADRGSALRGEAGAMLALGNLAGARTLGEEALRVHALAGEVAEELDDALLLVDVESRAGDPQAAEEHLARARELQPDVGTRGAALGIGLLEARLAEEAGDPARALQLLAALAPDVATGDYAAGWQADGLAARSYELIGAPDSAAAAGRRAVASLERVRGRLSSEPLRALYVTDRSEVYAHLVLALLQLGRSSDAFEVADAARSRALLENLSAMRQARGPGPLPRSLAERDVLLRRIDALVQSLRETDGGAPRERGVAEDAAAADILRRLEKARAEYEALVVRSSRDDPDAAGLLGAAVANLGEVQQVLDEDEALLEYLVTPGGVVTFVVRRDRYGTVRTEVDGRTLSHRVRLLRELWGVAGADWTQGLPASRALYEELLRPAVTSDLLGGVSRLVVVPQGILGLVPFAALQDSASGRFLVQDVAITVFPSAAALAVVRHRPSEATTGGVVVLAPHPRELPATAAEAKAIRRLIPGAVVREGRHATEAALREALTERDVVHVASHGVLNAHTPMFSRVELARPRRSRPDDDGRLEVHELLSIPVRSRFVFFSGCETGASEAWLDEPVAGTGDLSLAQATLAAGAADVVSTLWRIDDDGAAAFAERFYLALGTESARDALAMAQRQMAEDASFGSPYYWAGYALSGEGRFRLPDDSAMRPQIGQAASVR